MKTAMKGMIVAALAIQTGAMAGKWQKSGSDMTLSDGALSVKVVSQVGRLKEFNWYGTGILDKSNQGSMFYPAPQSAFPNTWPPPVGFSLDNALAFLFTLDADSTILDARPAAAGSGTIYLPSRTYSYDARSGAFTTVYGIRNTSTDSTAKVAGWEISRIPTSSFVFFPKGEAVSVNSTYDPVKEDSIVWANAPGGGKKIFRDGREGWLAAVVSDTLLFVKQFPDVLPSEFAPGETEIELYTGSEGFEMEQQGPYTTLKPGDSLTWTVNWYVKPVPKSIATSGNHALVDSVRSVLRAAAVPVKPRFRTARPANSLPFVDARGRLLSKSDRALKAGRLGVLPLR
jgi:hypothetical protein